METRARMELAAMAAHGLATFNSVPYVIDTTDRHKPFTPKGEFWQASNKKKLSRNKPCPCGSGRKSKHCCVKK